MDAPVIRISIGKFDAGVAARVEAMLGESRARLDSGIRAMRGHIAYYAGVDHANHAMHNVSLWQSLADAEQMASFAPMLELAKEFADLGVRFERPILNFDTLWRID